MLRTRYPKNAGNTVHCRVSVVYPPAHLPGRSCGWRCCPASRESIILPITSLGKDQNPKFKVWFLLSIYCFCSIVKSKNLQLSHCKLGNFCGVQARLMLCVTQISKAIGNQPKELLQAIDQKRLQVHKNTPLSPVLPLTETQRMVPCKSW